MEDRPAASGEEADPYGAAIRDHYEDRAAFEVIERDDGFVGLTGGPETYFRSYEEWPDHQRAAIDRAEGPVLDVGCGAGRHALHCQREGHQVVGIDVSPGAVEVARERGVEDVRQIDVRDVDRLDERFRTVLMLGNNFGLVGTRETAPERLRALAAVTTDDATVLAESRDPYATDDPAHREYHRHNCRRGRLPGALRMRARYRGHVCEWFDYLIVDPEEMAYLLEGTPWELQETIDGENGVYVGVLEKG